MCYLVMECHASYAIVMDQNGSFLKAANLNYEVGQRVQEIIIMNEPPKQSFQWKRQFSALSAAAACICIMLLGSWQYYVSPIGTVRMSINPEVQMSVNRSDYVIGLEGLNEDGEALIEDMYTFGKKLDTIADELADNAVELGYLHEGGKINLTVDSSNVKWKKAAEEMLVLELEIHLNHSVQITTGSSREENKTPEEETVSAIVIPVVPEESTSQKAVDEIQASIPNHDSDDDDDDSDDDEDDRDDEDDSDESDNGEDDRDDEDDSDESDNGEDERDDEDDSDDSDDDEYERDDEDDSDESDNGEDERDDEDDSDESDDDEYEHDDDVGESDDDGDERDEGIGKSDDDDNDKSD